MSVQHIIPPESSRQGEAREGMEKDNNKRPTLPAGIGANRTRKWGQPRPHQDPPSNPRTQGLSTLKKQLRISHLNCNKSRVALEELTLVRSRDDILLITEPPLTDGNPPTIDGYHLISHEGTETRTCAYIKDRSMPYTSKHTAKPNTIRMTIPHNTTLRCNYSAPNTIRGPEATEAMDENEIRMGDYNAAHPDWKPDDPPTTQGRIISDWARKEEATERGPKEGTRGDHKLDLIFTKGTNIQNKVTILHNGRIEHSDHKCQSIKFECDKQIDDTKHSRIDYKKVDTKQLQEKITNMNLPKPTKPDELIAQLERIQEDLPKKRSNHTNRLPQTIINARRKLNSTLKHKQRYGPKDIQEARLEYRRSIRNHGNEIIRTTLQESNDDDRFFELNKRGTTKKAIPPLTFEGITYESHEEIAQCLGKYHDATETEPNETATTDATTNPIEKVNDTEISEGIRKAPTNSTLGKDDVGIKLLSAYHKANPGYIGDVFTQILQTGKHPKKWKEAVIVPIPKANKPRYDHPKSWRSLHLLSLVSKTLERVVLKRLQDYGDRNETLGPTQFGSRRHTGTSDAYQIYREWEKQATSEGYHTTCILTDIEGGFDKVNANTLVTTSDIDPKYTKWILDWTKGRRLNFRFNGKEDKRIYVCSKGLPQGSPLSPYLFGAYVKDIVTEDFIDNVFIISYVDDLLICIKGKSQEEMEQVSRAAWQALVSRAEAKGMTFAENKTKTFHGQDVGHTFTIGKRIKDLRFLGYWTTTRKPGEDPDGEHDTQSYLQLAER